MVVKLTPMPMTSSPSLRQLTSACCAIALFSSFAAGQEKTPPTKPAEVAKQPVLLARALVAESRALISMQDFSRGEQLLGRAELVLKSSPSPEMSADVFLAYSSLSFALGKLALSVEYAGRGLAAASVAISRRSARDRSVSTTTPPPSNSPASAVSTR